MLTKDTKGDVPVWMKTCLWNLANALWEVVQGKKSNFNRWKVKTHVLGSMLKKGRIGRQIQVKRVQSWVFYSYMYFFKIEETWACLWADKKEPVEREWTTQKREVWTSSSRTNLCSHPGPLHNSRLRHVNRPLNLTNGRPQLSTPVACTKSLKVNPDPRFLTYSHILLVPTICPASNQF